jgi:ubiquinol-cytochrome c reductase cytochrome c1 subunit
MKRFIYVSLLFGSLISPQGHAQPPVLPQKKWSFAQKTGVYDRKKAQRGVEVYQKVCSACHSLSLVRYRDLGGLGLKAEDIKSLAAEKSVEDGPNKEGDRFERPAGLQDPFVAPFKNSAQARVANNGALPPDLSLIIKARPDGPNYVFALLTGYASDTPSQDPNHDGLYQNPYMSGGWINMAPPLTPGVLTYADGTTPSVEEMAENVVHFLAWASDPHMEHRKALGVKVLFYLFCMTVLFYAAMRRIWANVKK